MSLRRKTIKPSRSLKLLCNLTKRNSMICLYAKQLLNWEILLSSGRWWSTKITSSSIKHLHSLMNFKKELALWMIQGFCACYWKLNMRCRYCRKMANQQRWKLKSLCSIIWWSSSNIKMIILYSLQMTTCRFRTNCFSITWTIIKLCSSVIPRSKTSVKKSRPWYLQAKLIKNLSRIP